MRLSPTGWPALGLRARVSLLVTASATLVISVMAVVILNRLEQDLVEATRAGAEEALVEYLGQTVLAGSVGVGVVDEDATTRFFYRDGEGKEITEAEYVAALFGVVAGELGPDGPMPLPLDAASPGPATGSQFGVDPSTGLALVDGQGVVLDEGPTRAGEPRAVDLGPSLVAVEQALAFPDGSSYSVGVASTLRPVNDSIDAVARMLYLVVPALVVGIAIMTWLAANRALRHVDAISSQARVISATNLDQRVPVPPARDEIHELANTVNHMLERIQGSYQQQRQLVADAAHELRSPVAASRVQLEVGLANPEATDWQATAATVLDEQTQLTVLIDDLLALARMAEAEINAESDVDLDEIVLAEAQRARACPVIATIHQPARLTGDPNLLTRAIRNLVDNASRHAESQVIVTLDQDGDRATVLVDDDGPGVPLEQRSMIFDRFARLDEARTRHQGGAGLGLAIAREVAATHGGTVECTDSPLGGARFALTLPLDWATG